MTRFNNVLVLSTFNKGICVDERCRQRSQGVVDCAGIDKRARNSATSLYYSRQCAVSC